MIPRASVLITTELDSDVGTLGGLCAARGAVRSSLDPVKVMPGAPPRARMVTNCIRTVHVDTQDLGKCMGSGKWVGHDPSGAGWPELDAAARTAPVGRDGMCTPASRLGPQGGSGRGEQAKVTFGPGLTYPAADG